MTFCFIQAIERGHGQGATYGSILTAMRHAIRGAGSGGGGGGGGDVVTTLIGMLLTGGSAGGGFQQVPSYNDILNAQYFIFYISLIRVFFKSA